ncbi:unnamed protein product [Trichobilharzia regenti]|nr:unnamed protein product [Trichobilharzia regenti]
MGGGLEVDDEGNAVDDEQPKPLAQRLGISDNVDGQKATTSGSGRGKRKTEGTSRPKPAKTSSAEVTPTKRKNVRVTEKRKRTNRNPWESSTDSDASGSEVSMDNDVVVSPTTAANRARRAAAASVKYVFDNESSEEDGSEDNFKVVDHGQGDKAIEVPDVPAIPKKKEAAPQSGSSSDAGRGGKPRQLSAPPKSQPTIKSMLKPVQKKTKAISSDEDSDDNTGLFFLLH